MNWAGLFQFLTITGLSLAVTWLVIGLIALIAYKRSPEARAHRWWPQ